MCRGQDINQWHVLVNFKNNPYQVAIIPSNIKNLSHISA